MDNGKMKAMQMNDYGGPEVLRLAETAVPQAGEGQVLIHVHAAGVNPVDWKIRSGQMRQFRPVSMPWTPGVEGAGVIEAVGPGVLQFQPGMAVYGPFPASYAEFALAQASDLQLKPEALSFEEAASIPVGALTAWGSVIDAANVEPGQVVLVQGAAGGVGLFAVQLARWLKAKVLGTASTANQDFVRSLGAEPIDYSAGPFEEKARGVDVVIDTVGGEVMERSLKLLKPGGVLVTVAAQVNENTGKALGVRAVRGGRAAAARLKDINVLVEEGKIRPEVYKIFPLEEAGKAQALSETGHGRGRIVLSVAG